MKKYKVCLNYFLAFLVQLCAASSVYAFPIASVGTEGLNVIVGGTDDVIATYEGNSAAYSNDLYLVQPGDDLFIFNNQSSAVGSTFNLGSFDVGTELVFRLYVNNTGYDYFTGEGTLNPDFFAHARVEENWKTDTTLVSFEDLYNGPFNFNDLSFSFTNTVTTTPVVSSVPEPSSILLFGLGLVGLTLKMRVRGNI